MTGESKNLFFRNEADTVLNSSGNESSLDKCFQLFDIAYAVTTNPEAVYIATRDVITEFCDDGVIYLELRTTPRSTSGIMSKKQYLESVIKAIGDVPGRLLPANKIIVKLLVSVNRREGPKIAEENIQEAIDAHSRYPDIVVGVDLSGNPRAGHFKNDFLPVLNKARDAGLKVVLHCAEIPNESEAEAMLQFGADRLGHGTCLHPTMKGSQKLWDQFLLSKIPLEVCLTSNVKCQTVNGYHAHHMGRLLSLDHPIAVSTDDKGVFGTTLSMEYMIAAQTFNLQGRDLCKLVHMAIGASFADQVEKDRMYENLFDFKGIEKMY